MAIERGVVAGPRMLVAVHAIVATGDIATQRYREGRLAPETWLSWRGQRPDKLAGRFACITVRRDDHQDLCDGGVLSLAVRVIRRH